MAPPYTSRVAFAAVIATAFVVPTAEAATSLSFSVATGKLSGTISTATIPSVFTVPAAAALLGAVGYTTEEKLIYGPFEAGFGSGPTATTTSDTRPPYPCVSGGTYSGYCPGGMDVGTCEAALYNSCPSGSVRDELFMDDCGGHATPYHHHTDPVCLYDPAGTGHSALVGVMNDGRVIFGRNEDTATQPTNLDACGGHTGSVPAYSDWGIVSGTIVYHYHVQTKPPYLLGCYGPVSSVAECKTLYASGTQKCDAASASVQIGATYSLDYDLYCPCYEGYTVPEHNVTTTTTTTTAATSGAPDTRFSASVQIVVATAAVFAAQVA